jgi:predicted RNase H-like nuclease (RuvC/YqgF family)
MQSNDHHNPSNLEECRRENHHLREKNDQQRETICHLEEIVRCQRPLIDGLEKEKQRLLENIKDLEAKLATFTKAQLIRQLSDLEKNATYSNVKGSVVKASDD